MNDLKNVYFDFWKDLKETVAALPVLLCAGALYMLLLYAFNVLTFSFGGGLLLGIVGVMRWMLKMLFLAHFATLMTRVFTHHQLHFDDFFRYDRDYFFQLTEALFWIYIVTWALERMLGMMNTGSFLVLLWQAFSAPAYEAVYIGHEKSAHIFPALVDFWQVNWVPALAYGLVALGVYTFIMPGLFTALGSAAILSQALLGVFYGLLLYTKAILFRILYFSNPRSRAFHNSVER